jgi:hypothetical protein
MQGGDERLFYSIPLIKRKDEGVGWRWRRRRRRRRRKVW